MSYLEEEKIRAEVAKIRSEIKLNGAENAKIISEIKLNTYKQRREREQERRQDEDRPPHRPRASVVQTRRDRLGSIESRHPCSHRSVQRPA